MTRIHSINEEAETATCDGARPASSSRQARWRVGLVPRVLTNNLGVSVAGTTSVAGGVASFRYGSQADNAVELEVVTGTGEMVRCSREKNRDLFDVVRCGFGQFGIITRVTHAAAPLRPEGADVPPALRRPRRVHARLRGDHAPGQRALPHARSRAARRARSSPSASARA